MIGIRLGFARLGRHGIGLGLTTVVGHGMVRKNVKPVGGQWGGVSQWMEGSLRWDTSE